MGVGGEGESGAAVSQHAGYGLYIDSVLQGKGREGMSEIMEADMLYEYYNENNTYDNEQIRADFNELYQQMNGMPLPQMDNIVYPVCRLCRDHEKAGFIEGIRLGVLLAHELTEVQA